MKTSPKHFGLAVGP